MPVLTTVNIKIKKRRNSGNASCTVTGLSEDEVNNAVQNALLDFKEKMLKKYSYEVILKE